jgi:predicted nuclease of predicted toxin-antitoxin system
VRARLYLDEDVIPEVARILRSRGIDAVSVHEVGATGLSDEEQLERATAENRVLLTNNYRDFLGLFARWLEVGRPHAGIIVSYRQYTRDELRLLADAIEALLDSLDAEDLRNALQTLDSFRVR